MNEFRWLGSSVEMMRAAASDMVGDEADFLTEVADEIDELLADHPAPEVVEMLRPKIVKSFDIIGSNHPTGPPGWQSW